MTTIAEALRHEVKTAIRELDNTTAAEGSEDGIGCAELALRRMLDILAAHDATIAAGSFAEPWRYELDVIYNATGEALAGMYVNGRERARIVACVNACAGIADPGALVPALRKIAKTNGSAAVVARTALGGGA